MMSHDEMLDTVAVYALGALPERDTQLVREHLPTCEECREEYRRLRPVADAIAVSAEACADARNGIIPPPPAALKERIMARIISR